MTQLCSAGLRYHHAQDDLPKLLLFSLKKLELSQTLSLIRSPTNRTAPQTVHRPQSDFLSLWFCFNHGRHPRHERGAVQPAQEQQEHIWKSCCCCGGLQCRGIFYPLSLDVCLLSTLHADGCWVLCFVCPAVVWSMQDDCTCV